MPFRRALQLAAAVAVAAARGVAAAESFQPTGVEFRSPENDAHRL